MKLSFGDLPDRVSAGTVAETTVSIVDDDVPEVTVTLDRDGAAVLESDDPATTGVADDRVTITVTLSADPERSVTIPILRDELDGASAADYSGVPQSVVFAPGQPRSRSPSWRLTTSSTTTTSR